MNSIILLCFELKEQFFRILFYSTEKTIQTNDLNNKRIKTETKDESNQIKYPNDQC